MIIDRLEPGVTESLWKARPITNPCCNFVAGLRRLYANAGFAGGASLGASFDESEIAETSRL